MDGKSILGILLLAAGQGTRLELGADGDDEKAAIDALASLVASGFGEESVGAVQLTGIGVSPGIAVGPALIVEREDVPVVRLRLAADAVEAEADRFLRAVAASSVQLQGIKERLARDVGSPHGYIFDAHLLMLEDPLFKDRALSVIREDHVNAEWALRTVAEELHERFDGWPTTTSASAAPTSTTCWAACC